MNGCNWSCKILAAKAIASSGAIAPFVETADPHDRTNLDLEALVPDNPNRPYDMVKVVEEIVDDGHFMELFDAYADNIIIGFAR